MPKLAWLKMRFSSTLLASLLVQFPISHETVFFFEEFTDMLLLCSSTYFPLSLHNASYMADYSSS